MLGRNGIILLSFLLAGCGNSNFFKEDPLAKDQWYLNKDSDINHSATINLLPSAFKGRGVTISIVDDGVDLNHPDLKENLAQKHHSYLSVEGGFSAFAQHGTSVAGIIAAEEGNGIGIRGIAPKVSMMAFNVLRLASTSNLADALTREIDVVDISNNSWGDVNGWGEPLRLKSLVEKALEIGTSEGRNGKGINYVFSAGNGTDDRNNTPPIDNVNYSGLVNNRFTMPICAVDPFGKKAFYSESGATLLVCAPSKNSYAGLGVVTTDISGNDGYNPDNQEYITDYEDVNYTRQFGGTSAAAPMVSGIIALMLEANPTLSYRDVKYILALTAQKNDENDEGWSINGAQLHVNHKYGFGLVDAKKAVVMAKEWKNLEEELSIDVNISVKKPIPDNDGTCLESTVEVNESLTVEFVDIFFNAPDHENIGDLEIRIISPSATESILAQTHQQRFGFFRYNNWRFGSIRFLGENSKGKWRLLVTDKQTGKQGSLHDWALKIYGHAKPDR